MNEYTKKAYELLGAADVCTTEQSLRIIAQALEEFYKRGVADAMTSIVVDTIDEPAIQKNLDSPKD